LDNSTTDPAEANGRRAAVLQAAAMAAAALLALLAFLTLPDTRAHGWDEAMHLELPAARMLVALQQGEWGEWGDALLDCSQYPPGWPLVLSLWQSVCGIGESSARALSCLSLGLFALGVYLVGFAVARNALVAWLGFAIVALSPLCWAYGGSLFLEVPFAAVAAFTLHAWLTRLERAHGALCAGAWFTCAFFIKFNYGLMLLAGLGGAWLVEVLQRRQREPLRDLLQLTAVPLLAGLLWFVLLRGAEHREALLGFLGGNRDFAPTRAGVRAVHAGLFLFLSPRELVLVLGLALVSLHRIRDVRVQAVWCVALALSLPAWLHPFHLDRFLVPQVLGPAALASVGLLALGGKPGRSAWLGGIALLVCIPGDFDRLMLARSAGMLSEEPRVAEYQRAIYSRWKQLASGRELPTNGLDRAAHAAIADALAREAGANLRMGWIGMAAQFPPAALHLARLERGMDPSAFLRESDRQLDLDYFGGGEGVDAARLGEFAQGFDRICFTRPHAWRNDPARESMGRFVEELRASGWKEREVLRFEIERPLAPALPVQLWILEP
jgi:hypothetical protein